jgi:hypothetical protein
MKDPKILKFFRGCSQSPDPLTAEIAKGYAEAAKAYLTIV